jgi:ribosomal protein S12 methylthiotransferase
MNTEMIPKFALISLGCAKNLVNSEQMLYLLTEAGYEPVSEPGDADFAVINTCGFIDAAKSEAIDTILETSKLKINDPDYKIIVTGCLSERYKDSIHSELPEIDGLLGVGSFGKIAECAEAVLSGSFYSSFENSSAPVDEIPRVLTTGPSWAYLRIAEGCDNFCSFCAIPYIRGRYRSRKMENIIEEAEDLADHGVKELIVIAQDITRYGTDLYGRHKLSELIRKLSDIPGIGWIRLHYLYPDQFDDELIEEIASNPKVCKYLDIPIQHINNEVLERMNRHGDKNTIIDAIKRLRERVPDITLRTTVITGFPGETEEQFEELCEFIKETKFDRLGAFAYSREEDTPAYDFEDQIDEQVKQDRCDKIMALQSEISETLNKKKLRTTVKVLCEGFDGATGAYVGRSQADAPDVDGKIFFDLDKGQGLHNEGDFVNVRITDYYDYDLVGVSKKG